MVGFIDHLNAEIQALERSLENDPRYRKLTHLRHVRQLYEADSVLPQPPTFPSPTEARGHQPRKALVGRETSPATQAVIHAADDILAGRTEPMRLRDLHHEIVDVHGCPIPGRDPINNLSAILSRYGFRSAGRIGWLPRQEQDGDPDDQEADHLTKTSLFCAERPNGAAAHAQ